MTEADFKKFSRAIKAEAATVGTKILRSHDICRLLKLPEDGKINGEQFYTQAAFSTLDNNVAFGIISPKFEKSKVYDELIPCLAHEVGHAFDFNSRPRPEAQALSEDMAWARKAILREGAPIPKMAAFIVHGEQVAWDYAKEMLTRAGYTDWPTYEDCKRKALATYTDMQNAVAIAEAEHLLDCHEPDCIINECHSGKYDWQKENPFRGTAAKAEGGLFPTRKVG